MATKGQRAAGAGSGPARGYEVGDRVEKDSHLGTVAAKPSSGYAVDEGSVFVTWDSWPGKPSPSPEPPRHLLMG
jgi:hypothetical protein